MRHGVPVIALVGNDAGWTQIAREQVKMLLVKGVALWGGLMFVFMAVVMALQLGAAHPRLPLVLAVALPLCAIGGLAWGVLTWIFNERIFRALPTMKR